MEVYTHKDLASCSTMCLNSTSSLALLAGRRYYAVVDLANPATLLAREARQSKWEVVCSEWSAVEEGMVAVASNNKVEVLRMGEGELVVESSLAAHSRVVTDIAWHTQNSTLLATSSQDNCIHLWDLRDLRRPGRTLSTLQGAAKIEWNKVSGKYLASAHDGEVKLWDERRLAAPVLAINAHLSRIYALDWSWDHEDSLVTSSQDSTVMFWNVSSPGAAEHTMKVAGAPVWRLQHTPFGSGLLTLVMRTLVRGENNLVLWNRADLRAPVHTFYGHTDMVLGFGWRCGRQGDPRTRLVTWSKDGTLRRWEIDAAMQRRCGQEVEEVEEVKQEEEEQETCFDLEEEKVELRVEEEEGAVIVSSPLTAPATLRARSGDSESEGGETTKHSKSMNLNYEFKLLNVSEKLTVVAQDARERLFTVSAETSQHLLILHVKFPPNYPNQKAPVFSFLNGTTVDNHLTRSTILNKVRSVAKKEISRNRRCLEPCLRQFEASVAGLEAEEAIQLHINNPQLAALPDGGQDHNIPFPRSSGARFCGDSHLVTFGSTRQYSVPVAREEAGEVEEVARTPRALHAMQAVPSGAASPKYSVTSMCGQSPAAQEAAIYYPYKARVPRVRFAATKAHRLSVTEDYSLERKGSAATPTVTIYSCSGLLPPGCKELATTYLVPSTSGQASSLSLQQLCERNAAAAALVDRADLVQVWSLVGLSAGGCEEGGLPWAQHPLGRAMVEGILAHYTRLRDIQTVAVLSAVLAPSLPVPRPGREGRRGALVARAAEEERRLEADSCLLDPATAPATDQHLRLYSDLLYCWGLLTPRTELLKCLTASEEESQRADIAMSCTHCSSPSSGPACTSCRRLLLQCCICRLSCRGLSMVCHVCGHGGHTRHLVQWFAEHPCCPAGCGCPCPSYSS